MLRLPAALLVAVVCGILLPHAAVAGSADPLDGLIVREVRVTGLRNLEPAAVTRHLATRAGQPFHKATADLDRRRLDELRLFSAVAIRPELDAGAVVVTVAVSETLRLLPTILIRVTDENGLSGGVGMRGLNLLGGGSQTGIGVMFGGETSVSAQVDATTITPGTWYRHLAFGYSSRSNAVYHFEEKSTTAEFRFARNFAHGLRLGGLTSLLSIDAGTSGAALSADGSDLVPTLGGFVTLDTLDSSTNPRRGTWAEVEFDRLTVDASSWTVILDGRRFQPLSERHGLGLFSLATFQTGEVGVDLPEYLQFALGGGNTVRGWGLGTRQGRNQFIGTAEYSFVARPVTPFTVFGINAYAGLQIVGFADVGMAWNNSTDFRAADAIDGYGAGVRVLVPFVDMIRIDVGWGEPGRGATAYFGISLKPARQRQRVR